MGFLKTYCWLIRGWTPIKAFYRSEFHLDWVSISLDCGKSCQSSYGITTYNNIVFCDVIINSSVFDFVQQLVQNATLKLVYWAYTRNWNSIWGNKRHLASHFKTTERIIFSSNFSGRAMIYFLRPISFYHWGEMVSRLDPEQSFLNSGKCYLAKKIIASETGLKTTLIS